MDSRPPTYKMCIVGDVSTGKSSLLCSLKGDDFIIDGDPLSTIGVDFWCKNLVNPKRVIQIWDTAGCERFISIAKTYFRRCNMAVYCCDLTDYESFENIKVWKAIVDKECVNHENHRAILVGLKSDLERDHRMTYDVLKEFAYFSGFEDCFIVSNKTREGLDELKSFIYDIPINRFESYKSVITMVKKKGDCCGL
jgi:small GTP-binding protein